ncbi:MAG: hypothetical protein Ta2B_10160 [Termitinemataceae bacterium]|nr:MAG: hypothetical protein Ta2B_10160 [Termitinemataceae bacterium]
MAFAKNKEVWRPNLLPRTDEADKNYSNPDNDPRGVWASGPCHAKTPSEKTIYEITTPTGRKIMPPSGTSWRFNKEKFAELIADNRIYFGENGNNVPRYKRFITEVQDGFVSTTIWHHAEVGHNQNAKKEVKMFNAEDVFATPKPERLLERVLTLSTSPGDLVLDSFLGSGTTAAVAHKMGRKYIGVEMGEQAKTHCAVRLQKVIDGEQGGISEAVGWKGGGGFRFFKLGSAVFDSDRRIKEDISFEHLAAHIFFTETKTPMKKRRAPDDKLSPFLGVHDGVGYALLYNGILHDTTIEGGNVLTHTTLNYILTCAEKAGIIFGKNYDKLIIYGEASRLPRSHLKDDNIEFKQTPYDIKVW